MEPKIDKKSVGNRKSEKDIKNGRNWVEVGPDETWIGQIDAEFYFLAIPHVKNSQKLCSRVILKDFFVFFFNGYEIDMAKSRGP